MLLKITYILVLVVLTAGCKSDDEATQEALMIDFIVPQWLLGTWDNTDINATTRFKTWTFTEETIILEWAGGESSNLGSGFQVVVETSNDSHYIFTFSQVGNDIVYVVSIEKVSATEFLLSGSDEGTYIKRN